MSDDVVLHLRGHVLVGPDEVRAEAWVLGGRVTFDRAGRPCGGRRGRRRAGCCPASSTRTATSGSTARGGVDRATAEQQASTDRDAGTPAVRDCGSPVDTRWIDERDDLPRIVRAGRHLARTRRYLRGLGHEIEPEQLPEYAAAQARVRGRLGQARRRLDRPGHRRPRALLAARRRSQAAIDAAHAGGRPGDGALLRRGLPARPRRRRHRLHRARHRAAPTRPVAVGRGARRRDRPDAGQHRQLPDSSRPPGRRGSRVYAAHMRRPARAAVRDRRAAPTRPACRSSSAPTRAAPSPHGLVAAEVAELVAAGLPGDVGSRRRVLGRALLAGPAGARGGRPGRPRRLRGGPARGRRGARPPVPGRAPRETGGLTAAGLRSSTA